MITIMDKAVLDAHSLMCYLEIKASIHTLMLLLAYIAQIFSVNHQKMSRKFIVDDSFISFIHSVELTYHQVTLPVERSVK